MGNNNTETVRQQYGTPDYPDIVLAATGDTVQEGYPCLASFSTLRGTFRSCLI